MTIYRIGLIFISLLIPAFDLRAQVDVYDSFGPGNSYNTGIAWGVSGSSVSAGYRGQAEFFIPDITGYLDVIQLATEHVSGSVDSNFYIAQDNGNGIPGTILESWTSFQNSANGVLTLDSNSQVLLQAGQQYWLCDEATSANSYNAWYENNQGVAPGFAVERSEWSWSLITGSVPNSGVFSVSVTPVPEPSTATFALCGLAFFCLRMRRTGTNQ